MQELNSTTYKQDPIATAFLAETDTTSTKPKNKLTLRAYQEESITQTLKAYKQGKNRLLISLPTGTGKTLVFAHLVTSSPGRSLIIAHREELIDQAFDKIKMLAPSADIGIVKATLNQVDSQIVVASIQTLSRETRLSQLKTDFSIIIIDEAHHSCSNTYKKVLNSLGAFNESPLSPLIVGVTATPKRGDGLGLDSIFQEIVYHRNLLEMIKEQYLCDLIWQDIKLNIDLDKLQTRAGDFIEAQLIKALNNSDTPKQILYAFKQYASTRKTLIFVPGVTLARSVATLFKQNDISCESIDGKLPPKERKDILNRLHTGKTQVIVNCMILTEGFDEPSIDCIIFARPTKSKSFYLQMLGRGTRLYPGKQNCLVIDLVGLSKRHSLVTLPTLLGIPKSRFKKKSLLAVTEDIEKELIEIQQKQTDALNLLKEQEKALDDSQNQTKELEQTNYDTTENVSQTQLYKEEKSVVTKPSKKVIRFNWLKLSQECYALSTGNGIIFLISEDQKNWSVIWRQKELNNLIAKYLTLEYAMGVAQDFVRELKGLPLTDIDADWRKEAVSEKQLSLLKEFNLPYSSNINKGQASDLIAIEIAKTELSELTNTTPLHSKPDLENPSKITFIATNRTMTVETTKATHKPTFAKDYFPQLTDDFIKYDSYSLNNYIPQGEIISETNKSQYSALTTCREYVKNYFDQEVGLILSGETGVGKTHLAIALLNELTNRYNIDTLFCDYSLLMKEIYSKSHYFVLNELLNKICNSQVILLDGFFGKRHNFQYTKDLLNRIITCCYKDGYSDKKLLITTKHCTYSYMDNNKENLSLGDVLESSSLFHLYNHSHCIEIKGLNKNRNQPNSTFTHISDTLTTLFSQLPSFNETNC